MLKSSGIFPISLVYQTEFFARNLQSTPPVNSFPLSSPLPKQKNGRRTQLRTPSVFEKRGFMFDFVSFALSRSDIHKNHRAYRKGRQVVVCVIAALRFQEVGEPTASAIGDGGLIFSGGIRYGHVLSHRRFYRCMILVNVQCRSMPGLVG